jgi:hypothetical protein
VIDIRRSKDYFGSSLVVAAVIVDREEKVHKDWTELTNENVVTLERENIPIATF